MDLNHLFAAARLRIAIAIERECSSMATTLGRAWMRERERVGRELAFAKRSLAQQRRRAREKRA